MTTDKLNRKSNIPLHTQAEELLRDMIQTGDYSDGKLLPKETELSKSLGISRNTLRQAINKLVFEGLLVRKKGYGTSVTPRNVLGNARNWMSFSQEMKTLGIEVHNYELHISKKRPTKSCSVFFSVELSERLLCLERLRGSKEKPFVYFISYFNPAIPISVEEDMSGPLYDLLKSKYGVEVVTSREHLSARAADSLLAEKLEVSEGAPILVRERFVYDANNIPVEYNIGYYRSDSFTYSISFTNSL